MKLTAACIQMRSGTEPAANLAAATALIRQAAGQGARFIATPEMTNLLDIRPGMARPKVRPEATDESLPAFCALAAELGIPLLIGSLAIALEDGADDRFANRSFLIGPDGEALSRERGLGVRVRDARNSAHSFTPHPQPLLPQGRRG